MKKLLLLFLLGIPLVVLAGQGWLWTGSGWTKDGTGLTGVGGTGTNTVSTSDIYIVIVTNLPNYGLSLNTNAVMGLATNVVTDNTLSGTNFLNGAGGSGGILDAKPITNVQPSALTIVTNAAPLTNTIVGFFWITNGANVYKVPVLQ